MKYQLNPLLESYSPKTIEKAAFSTYRKLRKQGYSEQGAYNKVIRKLYKGVFHPRASGKTYNVDIRRNLQRSYLDGKISWEQLHSEIKPLKDLAKSQDAVMFRNSDAVGSALDNFDKSFGNPIIHREIKKSPSKLHIFRKIYF